MVKWEKKAHAPGKSRHTPGPYVSKKITPGKKVEKGGQRGKKHLKRVTACPDRVICLPKLNKVKKAPLEFSPKGRNIKSDGSAPKRLKKKLEWQLSAREREGIKFKEGQKLTLDG